MWIIVYNYEKKTVLSRHNVHFGDIVVLLHVRDGTDTKTKAFRFYFCDFGAIIHFVIIFVVTNKHSYILMKTVGKRPLKKTTFFMSTYHSNRLFLTPS